MCNYIHLLRKEKPLKKLGSRLYIAIAVAVFALLILGVVVFSNNSAKMTSENSKIAVKEQIGKTIRLCYSIEGIYPPSIEYLEENYGLIIDEKYFVHYEIFADNIMPQFEVYETEANKGE